MAVTRLDVQGGVDRFLFIPGQGHMIGLPTRGGVTSNATTGVPTNSVAGFAPGALFLNFKGTGANAYLYVNTGTNASATWTNVV